MGTHPPALAQRVEPSLQWTGVEPSRLPRDTRSLSARRWIRIDRERRHTQTGRRRFAR